MTPVCCLSPGANHSAPETGPWSAGGRRWLVLQQVVVGGRTRVAEFTADHGSQTDASGWFCSGLGSADERRRQIVQRFPAPVRHPLSPWALPKLIKEHGHQVGAPLDPMGTTAWCRRKPGRHRATSELVDIAHASLGGGSGHRASPELTGHYRAASAVGEVVLVIS